MLTGDLIDGLPAEYPDRGRAPKGVCFAGLWYELRSTAYGINGRDQRGE